MSDDSDSNTENKRKRKVRHSDDSPQSSNSDIVGTSSRGRRRKRQIIDDSDSDSDSSLYIRPSRKRILRVESDAESSDSSSASSEIIVRRIKRTGRVVSDDSDDHGFEGSSSTSDWETELSDQENDKKIKKSKNLNNDSSSDSSNDEQSERCPICLITLKRQEIGTPASCGHKFCIECILEWSKNVNTCPVDRQEYKLILVRKDINSDVYKKLPIEPPKKDETAEVEEIVEDLTYCEICHSSDGEETMLLCDGCDLGFHLGCLRPPLEEVPAGAWYCSDCSPVYPIELYELQIVLSPSDVNNARNDGSRRQRNHSPRLIPRTRQTERVRRRIQNNRNRQAADAAAETSQQIERNNNVSSSTATTSRTRRRTKKRTQRSKKKKRVQYIYKIDEATGETIAVVKRKKSQKKRDKERGKDNKHNKTVRNRLKKQLGICPLKNSGQHLPDMKIQSHSASNSIENRRQQIVVPQLHLFGPRDELDLLSGSDDEYESGSGVITRRRPNHADVAVFRRARTKGLMISNPVTSTSDILGNILEDQTKFHSKNTKFQLDKNGRFIMSNNDNNPLNNNNYNNSIRQRPSSNNSSSNDNVPSSSSRGDDYNSNGHQQYSSSYHNSPIPSSTTTSTNLSSSNPDGDNNDEQCTAQDYTQRNLDLIESNRNAEEKKDKKNNNKKNCDTNSENNSPRSGTPYSTESDVDIYSDIETVSTSKVDEADVKVSTPPPDPDPNQNSDDNNDSEPDMIIDTEKVNPESEENTKEETVVTSTVDSNVAEQSSSSLTAAASSSNITSIAAHSTSSEIQSEAVQSSTLSYDKKIDSYMEENNDNDDDSEDGCPNFSIYSKESIIMAKNTDISITPDDAAATDNNESENNQISEISSSPAIIVPIPQQQNETQKSPNIEQSGEIQPSSSAIRTDNTIKQQQPQQDKKVSIGLYSDSEDETIVNKNVNGNFVLNDIRNMTEDISEEERSYTPCLDERGGGGGLEGLDTEMISDEDRNDFDESHDLKTASDGGDALEINAKESELDFTRPEDYEEGEIVDKSKNKQQQKDDNKKETTEKHESSSVSKTPPPPSSKKKDINNKKDNNKENEGQNRDSAFKKLSKSNKERNYRDKEKERSPSRDHNKKNDKEEQKKKKEKRKEIERYDVRAIINDPKRIKKDRFGRDIRRSLTRSRTRSPSVRRSRSPSPRVRRSLSRSRRSPSREWPRRKRGRSRTRRSASSYSRSRSPDRKRSRSKTKKRKRSSTRERSKRRKSRDRSKVKKKQHRSRSRIRSRSVSPKRRKEWGSARRRSREWTPSLSMSRSPEPRHLTPSWTPPRILDSSAVKPHNLTVILTNDSNKKKKDKKKKNDKKNKDNEKLKKKKRNDRTPPPSKEVFASGDNILVSVSFNKENETRDVSTKKKKDDEIIKKKKDKRPKTVKKKRDLTGVKPVAIIDLERSPFKELTPSPKDVIVLSDSDNETNQLPKGICDSSQQSTDDRMVNNYSTGPKTPPEPQVKFTLTSKTPQLRAISNPLHEPDDVEPEADQNDLVDETHDLLHKGPNTPPEPPNSPPSSPDAYDPFEPTKSRSPTPEPLQATQSNSVSNIEDNRDDVNSITETRSSIGENEKSNNSVNETPDGHKSHPSPLADVQPADSQSSIHVTPESNKSPERSASGSLINQSVQTQSSSFTLATNSVKPVAQTVPFSSVPTSIITSTPVNSNQTQNRINILNTALITPPSTVANRNVLPNTVKASPVKISPNKPTNKPTPIKPMPSSKNNVSGGRKSSRSQNGSDGNEHLNLDSPYSPGSSDYEDLFEPPAESPIKPTPTSKSSTAPKPTKSPAKIQNAFDALFGSPPYKMKAKNDNKVNYSKFNKKPALSSKTKQIGVMLDEDHLKILDELPNSAVEMQIKDKFLKKLNRQERVVEEVKLVLKPHYNKKHISKEDYKDILRRAVPKICHNKSGEINPTKIKNLIEAYVKKFRHSKKVTSSSSVNPQKI